MFLFDSSIYHATTLPCCPFFKATAKAQNSKRSLRPCQITGSVIFLSREEAAREQALCGHKQKCQGARRILKACQAGLSHGARTETE